MLFSCAKHLSDFCGVSFNVALISSSFSLVATEHFFSGFLYRSDPVDLTSLISSWMLVVLGIVMPENL